MTYRNSIWEKRQDRIAYLQDKVTQMGHDPEKYEIWHKELKALKKQSEREQWPGAWGDKTTKDQWSMIERAIGRKLEKCTDGELAKGLEAIRKEIRRRSKARKKVVDAHTEEQIKKLTAKGYVPLPQAGKEVRRVIREHKIFPGLRAEKPFQGEIKNMVNGEGWFKKVGPMTQGVVRLGEKENKIFVDPKQLLCLVINRIQEEQLDEAKNQAKREAVKQAVAALNSPVSEQIYQQSLAEVQRQYNVSLQEIQDKRVQILMPGEEGQGPRFVAMDQVTEEMRRQAARNARGNTR